MAMNLSIAQRYPSIVKDIIIAGHEIIAHSTDMNGTIGSSLSIADEEALLLILWMKLKRSPARIRV